MVSGSSSTGDRSGSGYGDSPAQTRYREPFRLLADVEELRDELGEARRELGVLREQLHVVHSSRSWRITAPLRALGRRLRGLRDRPR